MQATTNNVNDEQAAPILTVIVPVFNEEEVLPIFHKRLFDVLPQISCRWEVLYIDDGSSDGNPDKPPNWRRLLMRSFLPVRILWG